MASMRQLMNLCESGTALQEASGSLVHDLVYHGSRTPAIKRFEKRDGTRAVLFTTRPVQAQGHFFALTPEDAAGYGPHVSAYRLRVSRPLPGGLDGRTKEDLEYVVEGLFSPAEEGWLRFDGLMRDHHLQADPAQREDDWVHDFVHHEALTRGRDLIHGRACLDWEVLDSAECVRRMRERGYDGALVHEKDDASRLSWFVLDAGQAMFVEALS